MTRFDVPESRSTGALGLNNAGQVSGSYDDDADGHHGFVLQRGRYTRIDAPGRMVTDARGINDLGEIVIPDLGTGLDPVTPDSIALPMSCSAATWSNGSWSGRPDGIRDTGIRVSTSKGVRTGVLSNISSPPASAARKKRRRRPRLGCFPAAGRAPPCREGQPRHHPGDPDEITVSTTDPDRITGWLSAASATDLSYKQAEGLAALLLRARCASSAADQASHRVAREPGRGQDSRSQPWQAHWRPAPGSQLRSHTLHEQRRCSRSGG